MYKEQKPIHSHYVLPVHRALQVHPISPHQWGLHTDCIFCTLRLKPITHKSAIYFGHLHSKPILFLCQVDDYAAADACGDTVETLVFMIDDQLSKKMNEWTNLDTSMVWI